VRAGVQYACIIDNVGKADGVRLRKLMQVRHAKQICVVELYVDNSVDAQR